MKKILILSLFSLFIFSCGEADNKQNELTDNGVLDLGSFSIKLPDGWHYAKADGIDSFVGSIVTNSADTLNFDFSTMGYANHLVQTEKHFLSHGEWLLECYFCKPGVTYISGGDLKSARADEMKRRGITDTALVKVEFDPVRETKKAFRQLTKAEQNQYPNADYMADLTYKGLTKSIPIEIPAETKAHHLKVDSTAKYFIKTVWPKVTGKGITGIYIQSRKSALNLMISGRNLPQQQQMQALEAFKTIVIKIEGSEQTLPFPD
ncbi:hypothetical protein [Mucilaginibacter pedocola]|uniref:Uncharacterized protein n=1 Tax=Mucilaginibacter pedocola TaxID=1792845 RepID=A0A1S9P7E2_9SPHI|nr:hypothetical protein [Mucilaginibacter pedocola]OOQ56866.1 hypothetical protein BC343_17965 [Mucilaginibacter pedocola]